MGIVKIFLHKVSLCTYNKFEAAQSLFIAKFLSNQVTSGTSLIF